MTGGEDGTETGVPGPAIYVDADACPVKDEAMRVAGRHGLHIHFVSNAWFRLPRADTIHRVIVEAGPDVADDWIAEHATAGDIVITADIPLAARCLDRGALALGPTGKAFTADNIGMAMAMRDLNAQLRETGDMGAGGGKAFTRQDRSTFLQALEEAVRKRL